MKILLITHNPICTGNNMGKTFLSLFSAFRKAELCQLYVHPTIPDVDTCQSCYRITDRQVLKALPFGSPGGEVSEEQIRHQIALREAGTLPSPPKRGGAGAGKRLLRDTMWRVSRWYSKDLRAWLDREKPTCIFLAPGYAKFIYDIALKIAGDYELPIVTYICDDYYFVEKPKGWLNRMQLSALQKKTDRLMEKTSRLVAISQEIREAYENRFGVTGEVLMTGANVSPQIAVGGEIRNICYFGNLSAGRHASLAQIGKALDAFNSAHGMDVALRIYTADDDPERLAVFEGIAAVQLPGFVSGQAYEEAFAAADMLVHTESFDEKDMDLVKHSVSTKIADSLASGVPLLAYGPDSIASMKHLIRNGSAVTATSEEELVSALQTALLQPEKRAAVVEKALQTAAQYHDKEKNSAKLRAIFTEVEGKQA